MKKLLRNTSLCEFKKRILADKREFAFLVFILGVATFVRFFRIGELHFFTYDQARDDLIVKRILVDHKWTLLGPQSSMRGVYLPPFYYYTLVPILWASRLNPVGVDIYTATIGVFTVALIWYMTREFFGKAPALMCGALYATSPLIVELSRRAWNPNTQPFFVLLFIFLLYRLFKTRQATYLLFGSLALGYAVNLHYGALCLLPIWVFSFFWSLGRVKEKWLVILAALTLLIFGAPLIVFDLRHDFMLAKNVYTHFFLGERVSVSPKDFFEPMVASVFELFVALLSGAFLKTARIPFEFWGKLGPVINFAPVSIIAHKPLLVQYQWWGVGLFVAIMGSLSRVYFFRKTPDFSRKVNWLILNLLITLLVLSAIISRFYVGKFYFFYYIFLFPLPFLFLGFFFWFLWEWRWTRAITAIIFLFLLCFNLRHVLVFEEPERTIEEIKKASQVVAEDAQEKKTFNIAANYKSPDRWDHNAVDFRYFVEAYWGKRALGWQPEDYQRAEVLYVVAEGGLPDPVNSKIMEIEKFEPKRVLATWELPKGVVIYKLGR